MVRARALRTTAAVAAFLAAAVLPVPAEATGAPCTSDGELARFGVYSREPVAAGSEALVTVVALDRCSATVPWEGALDIGTENVDGRTGPVVAGAMSAGQRGVAEFRVPVPRTGLVHVDVVARDRPGATGWTSVVVHDAARRPVLDLLRVTADRGLYRATGITADVDAPVDAVTVSVRVDGREVVRSPAGSQADAWLDAPPPFDGWHGFDVEVPVPTGSHTVCLYLDDRVQETTAVTAVEVDCRQVQGVAPGPPSVVGSYDGLYRVPGGYRAAGWVLDPAAPAGAAAVSMTGYFVDPAAPAFPPRPPVRTERRTADGTRRDVAAVYPAFGPYHGFVSDSYLGGDGTGVRICVRADAGLDLGCREAVIRNAPLGALDSVTAVDGGARVRGWSLDQDIYGSTAVHVHVDGRPQAVLTADRYRADVDLTFPPAAGGLVRGYGGDHGFDDTVPLAPGRHDVCAYGINAESLAGSPGPAGANALLGCRSVSVLSQDPVGRLDDATAVPGGFRVHGWAADPDAPTAPLQVHTYRDGQPVAVTTANQLRPDLSAVDGGRYGPSHGWTTGTVLTGERAQVCSYALNVGRGSTNTTLGCRQLSRSLTPTGALDGTARSSATTTTVRGWALDPDTASPVDVHVYVDGRPVAVTTATGSRGDVAAAFPGWGAQHGYVLEVPAVPGQRACAYAVNTGQGAGNTTLGCRTT